MAKIAIDCDGVIANFTRAVNALMGLPEDYEPTDWNWTGKLTKADMKSVFNRIQQTTNFWMGLEPYRDNVRQMARWLGYNVGHDVWVMTSRAETVGLSTAKQTEIWLEMCGIKGYENHLGVVTVPYSEDKVDICSRLNIDWIVDDKTETIESMDRFPYLHAALLDRPWNQDADVKWRVKSLGEFLKEIK
jgi:hypothetical protein